MCFSYCEMNWARHNFLSGIPVMGYERNANEEEMNFEHCQVGTQKAAPHNSSAFSTVKNQLLPRMWEAAWSLPQSPSNLNLKHNKREWQEAGRLARILRRGLQGHFYVRQKVVVLLSIINSALWNSVCLSASAGEGASGSHCSGR